MRTWTVKLPVFSQSVRLPRPQLVDDLVETFEQWGKDDGGLLAASVAYYGALSFFPLILILLSLFGVVLRFSDTVQDAQQELLDFLAQNVAPVLADSVGSLLQNIEVSAKVSGPIGLGTLLLTAIGIFQQFETAFDRMWNIPRAKSHGIARTLSNVVFERAKAFVMMIGVGGLLISEFVAGMVLSFLAAELPEMRDIPIFWRILQTGASAVISCLAFAVLYKGLTKVKLLWNEALRGGILAGFGWELARQLLAYFVVGKQYNVYGVVGSFIGLMLWIYVACSIVFFGGEYVQVLYERRRQIDLLSP